jgi:hypothetical protein
MISESDLAYVAGVVDGEGSIFMSNAFSICFQISNTNLYFLTRILEKLKPTYPKLNLNGTGNNPHGKSWKKGYVIKTNNKKIILPILIELKPYLIAKKEQAEVCIQFLLKSISKEECYHKLKSLNRKGI